MQTPEDLKYTSTHEWVRSDEDTVTVGITDFAQDQLGDVVFVELPEPGIKVNAQDAVAVIESVKTASDIYAPVSGEIVEVNSELEEAPERINEGPYEQGWLFKIKPAEPSDLSSLLDAAGYEEVAEG